MVVNPLTPTVAIWLQL